MVKAILEWELPADSGHESIAHVLPCEQMNSMPFAFQIRPSLPPYHLPGPGFHRHPRFLVLSRTCTCCLHHHAAARTSSPLYAQRASTSFSFPQHVAANLSRARSLHPPGAQMRPQASASNRTKSRPRPLLSCVSVYILPAGAGAARCTHAHRLYSITRYGRGPARSWPGFPVAADDPPPLWPPPHPQLAPAGPQRSAVWWYGIDGLWEGRRAYGGGHKR